MSNRLSAFPFTVPAAGLMRLASKWEELAVIKRHKGPSYIADWLDNCARDLRLEIAYAEAWGAGTVAHSLEKTDHA